MLPVAFIVAVLWTLFASYHMGRPKSDADAKYMWMRNMVIGLVAMIAILFVALYDPARLIALYQMKAPNVFETP